MITPQSGDISYGTAGVPFISGAVILRLGACRRTSAAGRYGIDLSRHMYLLTSNCTSRYLRHASINTQGSFVQTVRMDAKHRAAFARRVDNMTIPWRVDMHKIRTRTARMNREKLLLWKEEMSYHEAHTKDPRERVYLVVSDLRLLALSENYSNAQGKWHSAHTELPTHSFLHERDINSLHESHWAVEINKHYYELVRLHGDRSKFSSDERVDENERQILARIFIGTSHLGRAALDAIGK